MDLFAKEVKELREADTDTHTKKQFKLEPISHPHPLTVLRKLVLLQSFFVHNLHLWYCVDIL